MGKVTAWQCIHCKTLFETKNLMENHRRKCFIEIKARLAAEARRREALDKAHSFRLELENINDIPNIIEEIVKVGLNRKMEITKWDIRFKTDLAPTHDAPIGKPTEWSNVKHSYAGWSGRIEGRGNLYSKPIEHDDAIFGRISSISDLCRAYIKGVHIRTGGGSDSFRYDVRLYLDDFPKLKAEYERWKIEADKKHCYDEKAKELRQLAQHELIINNERTLVLDDIDTILRARFNQISKEKAKIKEDVLNSKEYKEAITVPDEYKYCADIYYKFESTFK